MEINNFQRKDISRVCFPPTDMGCNSTWNPYCPRRSVISGNVSPDIGYVLTIAPEYRVIYCICC